MTPNEKLILVKNYIQQEKLNCAIEYHDRYDIYKNKSEDTYILIVGFKDRDYLNNHPKIYDLDEHITLQEINEIQRLLDTKNISFSLVKKEDFSIKMSLVMY